MALLANLLKPRGEGKRKLYASTAYVAGSTANFDSGLSSIEYAVANAYGTSASILKWASLGTIVGATIPVTVYHAESSSSVVVQASGESIQVTVLAVGY